MVSEGNSDLQRRDRRRTTRNMGASDFFHVTAAPRLYRNSAAHLAAYAKRPRIRRLDRPNSSSDSLSEYVKLALHKLPPPQRSLFCMTKECVAVPKFA